MTTTPITTRQHLDQLADYLTATLADEWQREMHDDACEVIQDAGAGVAITCSCDATSEWQATIKSIMEAVRLLRCNVSTDGEIIGSLIVMQALAEPYKKRAEEMISNAAWWSLKVLLATAATGLAILAGVSIMKPLTPPPPPASTVHEGQVSRVVVEDPHTGGWSGHASNPQRVILTVSGTDYDLEGPLTQAATVKPGDQVRITCTQYETAPDAHCRFSGLITELPLKPKQKP